MAGNIASKERAIVTLSSTIASMTNGSAAIANATASFDARTGGNAPDDFQAQFQWQAQWATITGIVAGTIVAELYLVPKLDGTNAPDIDTTVGSSKIPFACLAGTFEAPKAPTANTNMLFVTPNVYFNPMLYDAYILNRSGQTTSANSTLKAVSVQGQYT